MLQIILSAGRIWSRQPANWHYPEMVNKL